MKIIKINYISENYIKYFYAKYGKVVLNLSYQEHLDFFFNDGFGGVGAWARNLRAINTDAEELIINDRILLKKLAKELNSNNSDFENILVVIKDFSPDIIVFSNPNMFNFKQLDQIKEINNIKKMIAWQCAPLNELIIRRLRYFDFILTCTPGFVELYSKLNIKSYLIYHSFDSENNFNINNFNINSDKVNELIFIGSLWLYNEVDWHLERLRFLNNIAKKFPVSYYLSIRKDNFIKANIKRGMYYIDKYTSLTFEKTKNYNDSPKYIKLPEGFKGHIKNDVYWGRRMIERLSQSTMALNFHVGAAGEYAGNIRLFEAAGAGTCLITDKKKNIVELFEPDKEIVVYEDQTDCIEKIKYLYNNPNKAIEIGKNARERILKEHTTKKRMNQFIEILNGESY